MWDLIYFSSLGALTIDPFAGTPSDQGPRFQSQQELKKKKYIYFVISLVSKYLTALCIFNLN